MKFFAIALLIAGVIAAAILLQDKAILTSFGFQSDSNQIVVPKACTKDGNCILPEGNSAESACEDGKCVINLD